MTTVGGELTEALGDLRELADDLSHTAGSVPDGDVQLDVLLQSLRDLHARIGQLRDTEAFLEREAVQRAKALRAREGTLPSGIPWKLMTYRPRAAWDHDALTGRVIEAHLTETGGDLDPDALVRALKEAAHIDYWRSKVLRELGIQVDEYCESKPAVSRVQFMGVSS